MLFTTCKESIIIRYLLSRRFIFNFHGFPQLAYSSQNCVGIYLPSLNLHFTCSYQQKLDTNTYYTSLKCVHLKCQHLPKLS